MDFRSFCLFQRSIDTIQATGAYLDLLSRYEEPHRKYHTLTHIGQCLEELGAFARDQNLSQEETKWFEIAIWFHDAVYDIGADDNEKRSAELMFKYIESRELVDLVMATEHLGLADPPEHPAAQILISIDLSILGKDWETYDRYRAQIRQEYTIYTLEDFQEGRRAVLERLLAKPIYPHPWFSAKYEVQARKNISYELQLLR